MRMLDLYCSAGGATKGYQEAGFEVVGVDIRPQPRYCGEDFILGDALEILDTLLAGGYIRSATAHYRLSDFDALHASPPCQGYSSAVSSDGSKWAGTAGKSEPRLIAATRARLVAWGGPWAMENVMGARYDLHGSLLLCGTMFGLPIPRHRIFEMRDLAMSPYHPKCTGVAKRFAGERGWEPRDMTVTGKGRRAGTSQRWAEIIGIDWMTQHEMREAIPPAYTEYLGRWLIIVSIAVNDGVQNTANITPIVTAQETNSSVPTARNGQSRMVDGVPTAGESRWVSEVPA